MCSYWPSQRKDDVLSARMSAAVAAGEIGKRAELLEEVMQTLAQAPSTDGEFSVRLKAAAALGQTGRLAELPKGAIKTLAKALSMDDK